MRHIRVQFILGRPGTGKTTLCLNQIAQKQQTGGDNALILLVPEQFSFSSEKALIAAAHGGISRAQVLSFHRLSYYVFSKTGGIDKKVLEDSGKGMLLRKLVSQLKNQLKYFKASQEKPGFLEALASSITEFYQYGVLPEDLLASADAAESANLRLKLADLHLIYSSYKEYLEQKYISGDAVLDILAEKIPEADFLRGAEIWVDGFKSFTPQERTVLHALMTTASAVKFVFCVDKYEDDNNLERFDAFFEAKDSIRKIEQIAAEIEADVEIPAVLEQNFRHKNCPELAFLSANFLGFSTELYNEKVPNIKIFSAGNIFQEIHAAAKAVVMLNRDRGLKYSEIGVVAADLAAYEVYIHSIFSQYNIPVFMDIRRDILSHPLCSLVFAALEVVGSNWQYEAVFQLLRSPLVQLSRDDIDLLENYVLAYNIRGAAWQKDFFLGNEAEAETANSIRLDVVAQLRPLMAFTSRRVYPVKDIAAAIYGFLLHLDVTKSLEKWIIEAHKKGDNEAHRQHEQIWGKLMDTLDKFVEILGDTKETVPNFAKILTAGIGDLGVAPPSLDQLVAGDLRRTRFGELAALIILGANEGSMPAAPETSGLLDDADKAVLTESGIKLAKDGIAKIYEEEFLTYAGFSKPSDYLAVSYSRGDLEGKAKTKSRLIERLTDLFPKISDIDLDKLPPGSLARISAPVAAFEDLIQHIGHAINDEKPIPPIFIDALSFFTHNAEFGRALADIGHAAEFSMQMHSLSSATTKSLYGRRIRTSVSKLERFNNCPFSYYVEYNLKARPRRTYEVAAADMGNIYHDILANFGDIVQKSQNLSTIDNSGLTQAIDAAIDNVFGATENQVLSSSGKNAHYAYKMRKISHSSAAALAEHIRRGDFVLAYNEVAFADLADDAEDLFLGAIQIPLDGGVSLFLDGRIDRVDMFNLDGKELVKIIDYKSGRRKFSLSEAYHGLDMQLLIYLAAFIQKLSMARGEDFAKKILPAAALYFNLLNPVVNFSRHFQDDPEAIKRELLKSFKMSGVVLGSTEVIDAMDKGITADSAILPVGLKKESTNSSPLFRSGSTNVTAEAFAALMDHAMDAAKTAGEQILSGNIAANPAKHKDSTPCVYCGYRSICKFDVTDKHGYRQLQYLKNDEVIERILQVRNGY